MLLGFVVTLLAGLAVPLGAVVVVTERRLKREWLAFVLAFAAGTMLLLSFMDLLPEGIEALSAEHSPWMARLLCFGAFFVGALLIAAIDRLVPERPRRDVPVTGETQPLSGSDPNRAGQLMHSGMMVALVIALHSVPEGMATFFSTYADPQVGVALGVAIALHNLPEGIAVAAPIYAATSSRATALRWATLAGLAEPFGGLLGALLVSAVIPGWLTGAFYGLVAGMMVFLAFDELLPNAWRYQTRPHQVTAGTLCGIGVVALSFVLFSV